MEATPKELKTERLKAALAKLAELKAAEPAGDPEQHVKTATMMLVEKFETPHPLAKRYLAELKASNNEITDAIIEKLTNFDDHLGASFMVLHQNTEQLLKGNKQMSRRFRRWGDPGDTFTVKGKKFRFVRVERVKVGDITEEDIRKEGYATKEDFEQMWYKSHPKSVAAGKRLDPEQNCWCHEYEEV